MPRMNGLEVLLALKRIGLQDQGNAMTAFENEEDIQRSMVGACIFKGLPLNR